MAARDIIVIGASAGGVDALNKLVAKLPKTLPASIFVVMHVPPHTPNRLSRILDAVGPLPAVTPCDEDRFDKGKIYVATPDHHLLLEQGRVVVKKGPKENRFPPSIDALFRST